MTTAGPLLALAVGDALHALPLIVLISLVYSATRHERWPTIFRHAVRLTVLISAFMLGALGVLFLLSKLA